MPGVVVIKAFGQQGSGLIFFWAWEILTPKVKGFP
jgi:hypothetical protein